MFDLRKLFFGQSAVVLPPALAAELAAWQALPEPDLGELHYHSRYIVLDIGTTGPQAESAQLVSIAALALERGGRITPDAAISLMLRDENGEPSPTVDAQLLAFLQFVGKAPVVTYHSAFVLGFLQKALKERLGIDFLPRQLDLAWLLPSMFSEKSAQPIPLDEWLQHFAAEFTGRRDVMENTLQLGRLFQRLLIRAVDLNIDTAERLLQESDASSFLRRNH